MASMALPPSASIVRSAATSSGCPAATTPRLDTALTVTLGSLVVYITDGSWSHANSCVLEHRDRSAVERRFQSIEIGQQQCGLAGRSPSSLSPEQNGGGIALLS